MRDCHRLATSLRCAATLVLAALPGRAQTFEWSDLVARQDLWPAQSQLLTTAAVGSNQFAPGTVVDVERIDAAGASILLAGIEVSCMLPPRGCSILEQARTALAAMTPPQRRLDCQAMARRGDLWPDGVTLLRPYRTLVDGKLRTFDKGTELTLGCFDGQCVRASIAGLAGARELPVHFTDFAAKVRTSLLAPPLERPSRVLRELDGKLQDLSTRKPVADGKPAPRFLVLYFAAAASPSSRQFSPQLVKFYGQHRKQAGQVFEVAWISRDPSQQAMQEHARTAHFPWLAVRWDALPKVTIAQAHAGRDDPCLVVLDQAGSVVFDSSRAASGGNGQPDGGLDAALPALGRLLDGK